jgi:hypothetical protein
MPHLHDGDARSATDREFARSRSLVSDTKKAAMFLG